MSEQADIELSCSESHSSSSTTTPTPIRLKPAGQISPALNEPTSGFELSESPLSNVGLEPPSPPDLETARETVLDMKDIKQETEETTEFEISSKTDTETEKNQQIASNSNVGIPKKKNGKKKFKLRIKDLTKRSEEIPCAVEGCHVTNKVVFRRKATDWSSSRKHVQISRYRMFPLPKQSSDRAAWISAALNEEERDIWLRHDNSATDEQNFMICERHFEDSEPTVCNPNPTLKLAKKQAEPSLEKGSPTLVLKKSNPLPRTNASATAMVFQLQQPDPFDIEYDTSKQKAKRIHQWCCIRSCNSWKNVAGCPTKFYKFPPMGSMLRQRWVAALRQADKFFVEPVSAVVPGWVCERHFTDGMAGRDAVPTKFLTPSMEKQDVMLEAAWRQHLKNEHGRISVPWGSVPCSVIGCVGNSSQKSSLSKITGKLFKLPKRGFLRVTWIQALKEANPDWEPVPPIEGDSYVCGRHFSRGHPSIDKVPRWNLLPDDFDETQIETVSDCGEVEQEGDSEARIEVVSGCPLSADCSDVMQLMSGLKRVQRKMNSLYYMISTLPNSTRKVATPNQRKHADVLQKEATSTGVSRRKEVCVVCRKPDNTSTLFDWPGNKKLRFTWSKAMGLRLVEDSNYPNPWKICSKHFLPGQMRQTDKGIELLPCQVPSMLPRKTSESWLMYDSRQDELDEEDFIHFIGEDEEGLGYPVDDVLSPQGNQETMENEPNLVPPQPPVAGSALRPPVVKKKGFNLQESIREKTKNRFYPSTVRLENTASLQIKPGPKSFKHKKMRELTGPQPAKKRRTEQAQSAETVEIEPIRQAEISADNAGQPASATVQCEVGLDLTSFLEANKVVVSKCSHRSIKKTTVKFADQSPNSGEQNPELGEGEDLYDPPCQCEHCVRAENSGPSSSKPAQNEQGASSEPLELSVKGATKEDTPLKKTQPASRPRPFADFLRQIDTPEKVLTFCRDRGLLRREPPKCSECDKQMTTTKRLVSDGVSWRCRARTHKAVMQSVRMGSFFANTHVPLDTVLLLAWLWAFDTPLTTASIQTGVSLNGALTWYQAFRDVCSHWLEKNPVRLGGVGRIVQIDEIPLIRGGKRRYLIGLRDTSNHEAEAGIVQVVNKLSSETIQSIIKDSVLPGTEIHTQNRDYYKGKETIEQIPVDPPYIHKRVKSSGFVDAKRGIHTNNARNFLKKAKYKVKQCRGGATVEPSYLDEFMWRLFNGKKTVKAFDNLLLHISEWYPV